MFCHRLPSQVKGSKKAALSLEPFCFTVLLQVHSDTLRSPRTFGYVNSAPFQIAALPQLGQMLAAIPMSPTPSTGSGFHIAFVTCSQNGQCVEKRWIMGSFNIRNRGASSKASACNEMRTSLRAEESPPCPAISASEFANATVCPIFGTVLNMHQEV